MELKWYWLAEQLDLVKNTSHLYNDGHIYYEVSAKADEFFSMLTLSCIPAFFLLGLLIQCIAVKRKHDKLGRGIIRGVMGVLLVYAVFLAVGIGPYIIWYPQDGGFIDLSTLEHVLEGVYCALLALMLWLGGRLGSLVATFGRRNCK